MSDLQRRTEALLRSKGYLVASVERRKTFPAHGARRCNACGNIPLVSRASDLFNVFDLLAIRFPKVVFVQVTSASNHAARRNKIIASPEAKLCILADQLILLQSWKKVENRWLASDEWISLDQFVVGLPDTVEQFYEDEKRKKLLMRGLPPSKTLPLSPFLKDSEMDF